MLQLHETTIEDLQKTLTSEAWKDLANEKSLVYRVISHPFFKDERGKISIEKLITFGILHCRGNIKDKAEVLFGVFLYGVEEDMTN